MKLIHKTILYYILISLPLLIIAALCSYYLISNILREGTDESLWREKLNAEKQIQFLNGDQNKYLDLDSLSGISLVSNNQTGYAFFENTFFDKYEEENINYRILRSYFRYHDKNYLITIAKPTIEEEDLLEGLFSTFALIIGFLLLGFFLVNWILSKTVWKPFYKTLEKLNRYEVKNHPITNFESSGTKEFNQLNWSLNQMTDKIYSDYLQQKEFAENASHEMQTPLAVLKASIGLLIQSPNIKEMEMNHIQTIDNMVKKLSSLNKSLLLLSKIENHQFKDETPINLKDVIIKSLSNYQPLVDSKNILVNLDLTQDLILIKCNPVLTEVLVSNLIHNAIRHNLNGGNLKIKLRENELTISNSGEILRINENELFERFKKSDVVNESLGLGLSIVKSICDNFGFQINYSCLNELHTFTLKF